MHEKVDKEKLLKHSENHRLKLREIQDINEVKYTLAAQHPKIASAKERIAWKSNWDFLCKRSSFIEKNKGYSLALQDISLNPVSIKMEAKPSSVFKIKKNSSYLDAKLINESLMANPEQTYKTIWGEPKSENSKEMRYDGGLIVSLKGKSRGLWHDFSEGIGGAPIQAIMVRDKLNFADALKVASEISGVNIFTYEPRKISHQLMKSNDALEKKNKISAAQSIWDGTVPYKGTLAEKYLKKHRGIKDIELRDVRYWPKGTPWINYNDEGVLEKKVNKIPALVIAARNVKNEITAVQRIYLDSATANKSTIMKKPKLSKGILEGSCGMIQKGMRGAPVYIAEGLETAASIAMADSKSTVLVSFGVSNIKNLIPIVQKFNSKDIILAADNDGNLAKSKISINNSIDIYRESGVLATAIFPNTLEGRVKTDWNDVLLKAGISGIKQQLFGYQRLFNVSDSMNVSNTNLDLINQQTLEKNSIQSNISFNKVNEFNFDL